MRTELILEALADGPCTLEQLRPAAPNTSPRGLGATLGTLRRWGKVRRLDDGRWSLP